MSNKTPKIGWIGVGRMGYQMAERLAKADYDISIWNRTKSKAEPLTKVGAKVVDKLADLAGVDMLFAIVSEGKDLEEVYFGANGIVTTAKGPLPKTFVDCSSISVDDSVRIRARLKEKGIEFVCAPVPWQESGCHEDATGQNRMGMRACPSGQYMRGYHAAPRALATSPTLASTRSAAEKSPARVSAVGTTQQRSPAATAARSPRSESSITRHSRGSTPARATAARYGSGSGLDRA